MRKKSIQDVLRKNFFRLHKLKRPTNDNYESNFILEINRIRKLFGFNEIEDMRIPKDVRKFSKILNSSLIKFYEFIYKDNENALEILSSIDKINNFLEKIDEYEKKIRLSSSKPARKIIKIKKELNTAKNGLRKDLNFFEVSLSKIKLRKEVFDFYSEINKARKRFKLGREWNKTISRAVVSGLYLPPFFSIFYYTKKDSVIFEINNETTKADLEIAWAYTKELRKRFFGKTRAIFPNLTQMENFDFLAETLGYGHGLNYWRDEKSEEELPINTLTDQERFERVDKDGWENYNDEEEYDEMLRKKVGKFRVLKSRNKKITG